MSYDPTDCEMGICGPCEQCQMERDDEEQDLSAEPEPVSRSMMDPADFASLLEREPSDASDSIEDWMQKCEDAAKRNLTLRATIDSQAARIKELEGVLVAVRAKAATGMDLALGRQSDLARASARLSVLDDITKLVNETLDPCKPWCVLEPGHGGDCCPQEDERE